MANLAMEIKFLYDNAYNYSTFYLSSFIQDIKSYLQKRVNYQPSDNPEIVRLENLPCEMLTHIFDNFKEAHSLYSLRLVSKPMKDFLDKSYHLKKIIDLTHVIEKKFNHELLTCQGFHKSFKRACFHTSYQFKRETIQNMQWADISDFLTQHNQLGVILSNNSVNLQLIPAKPLYQTLCKIEEDMTVEANKSIFNNISKKPYFKRLLLVPILTFAGFYFLMNQLKNKNTISPKIDIAIELCILIYDITLIYLYLNENHHRRKTHLAYGLMKNATLTFNKEKTN